MVFVAVVFMVRVILVFWIVSKTSPEKEGVSETILRTGAG